MDIKVITLLITVVAVLISFASFGIALRSDLRTKKAETIKNLLGNKETVAFAALKLLRDGLPKDPRERQLVLAAVLQACVFLRSDRARALLYRVIEMNREAYRYEIRDSLQQIRCTFASMDSYKFDAKELDLERGKRRVSAVQKVIDG